MKKSRRKTVDIHLPDCDYDVRISISEERPVTGSIKSMVDKKKIDFRRDRKRTTAKFDNYRFDLTTVVSGEKITKEVEVEITNFSFQGLNILVFYEILHVYQKTTNYA